MTNEDETDRLTVVKGDPGEWLSKPVPNWRVCSIFKVRHKGEKPVSLIIQSYTGVVAGLSDSREVIPLTPEDERYVERWIDDGALIRRGRIQKGMTIPQFAHIAGVTPQAVKYWEGQAREPRRGYWPVIERALGIKLKGGYTPDRIGADAEQDRGGGW